MTKAKSKYSADVISENSDNGTQYITFCIEIPPPALPEFTPVKSLCGHFSMDFVDKIETIRSKFPDKVQNIPKCKKQKLDTK